MFVYQVGQVGRTQPGTEELQKGSSIKIPNLKNQPPDQVIRDLELFFKNYKEYQSLHPDSIKATPQTLKNVQDAIKKYLESTLLPGDKIDAFMVGKPATPEKQKAGP